MAASQPVVLPQVTRRPPGASDAHAAVPGRLADVLDDHVDAALVGEPAHLGDDVLLVVVHDVIGAERPHALELGLGAGRGDHARAVQPRDLHRCLSDAAGRRRSPAPSHPGARAPASPACARR